ncbi:unnamed protein product [Brassicogethes aeneus]|uniref:Telomere-associated protein RIF1 n=1 Tax=Brassicogethes aeneus TaxID=1431903 RepID=A0A9P0FH50_BRAAE|nr:unnamed protein product [Brassicogethes aeneus]
MSNAKERCKIYTDSKLSIQKILSKKDDIDENVIKNQLILIKNDLISPKDESVRRSALEMLEFLVDNVKSVILETEVIKLVNSQILSQNTKDCIVLALKESIFKSVQNDTFNLTQLLALWKNQNILKLVSIIEELFKEDLSKEMTKKVFLNNIIPDLMNINTNNEIRNVLIVTAYKLIHLVPSSELTTADYQEFVKSVTNTYIKSISELREKDYENWHKLWIFIVRFCGVNMHNTMELTNKLLRVVEYAFRNQNCDQRLKGYDCWKELIDNASLNPQYLTSSKHIKLLITPLKAKFSKQAQLIVKRFEVFVYLLSKLGNKAVMCLNEFLEFCFGPVGKNSDPNKTGQGKTLDTLWERSISVLLELLGHDDHCLVKECNFDSPVINGENIDGLCHIISKSIQECSLILKNDTFDSKREVLIQCLWRSLFNIITQATEDKIEICTEILVPILKNLKKEDKDVHIKNCVFPTIFSAIIIKDTYFTKLILTKASNILLPFIFENNTNINYDYKLFQNIITNTLVNKDIFQEFLNYFGKSKINDEINLPLCCDSWIAFYSCVALEVHNFENSNFYSYLLWPLNYFNQMSNVQLKDIKNAWVNLYLKLTKNSYTDKINILREIEKLFKQNPMLISNIVLSIMLITQFETDFNKHFVQKIMDLVALCLVLPNLKKDDELKLTDVVAHYLESHLKVYSESDNEEAISKICVCLEHVLKIHKNFDILESLQNLIVALQPKLKSLFSKSFSKLIFTLYSDQSDLNNPTAKTMQKIMLLLDGEVSELPKTPKFPTPFKISTPPSSRSTKIANLLKNTPTTPKQSKPSMLTLFGKKVESPNSVKVKGSQLNNTPIRVKEIIMKGSPKTPKEKLVPSIDDESNSQFVAIDTEIKFRPEKLNDHQKEVLQKRREDIPALYQDLSQSQSQDIFNKNNSNSNSVMEKENKSSNAQDVSETSIDTSEEKVTIIENNEVSSTKDVENSLQSSKSDSPKSPKRTNSPKSQKADESSKKNKSSKTLAEEEKKRKIEAELKKLKMDIVAPDQFLLSTPRRSRKKPSNKDEEKPKKPSPEVGKRKSIAATLEIKEATTTADKRRKSTGSMGEISVAKVEPKRGRGKKGKNAEKEVTTTNKDVEIISKTEEQTKQGVKRGSEDLEDFPEEPVKKAKLTDSDTEDIIESSQEPSVCFTPISSPKKNKETLENVSNIDEEIEVAQPGDVMETQDIISNEFTKDMTPPQENLNITEVNEEAPQANVSLADTITQTESDPCNVPMNLNPAIIKLDLPKKIEMTESEQFVSNMDTVSLLSDMMAPDLEITMENDKKEDLQSSPITVHTPTKNTELLNVTKDISPIPEKMNSEEAQAPQSNEEVNDFCFLEATVHSPDKEEKKKEEAPCKISERMQKLVQGQFESPVSTHRRKQNRMSISPSASRIRKLMSPFGYGKVNLQSEFINSTTNEEKVDLFKFSKERPSLNGTPERSILKKKMSEHVDDGVSPGGKRKRVHFTYPTTTSKKVYLKPIDPEDMRLELINKNQGDTIIDFRDYIHEQHEADDTFECIYPLLKDCTQSIKCLFARVDSSYQKFMKFNLVTIGDLASLPEQEIFNLPFKPPVITNTFKALHSYHIVKILKEELAQEKTCKIEIDENNVESKHATFILYPELAKCYDLVENLFRKMKNLDLILWRSKLKEYGIKLVCDLVAISESKILRLPFKGPIVSNVYQALDFYYQQKLDNDVSIKDVCITLPLDDDDSDCIYPKLAHSGEPIELLFNNSENIGCVLEKLTEINIKTIGNLAVLTQDAILSLPIKSTSVLSIYKALDKFYARIAQEDKSKVSQESIHANSKTTQVNLEENDEDVLSKILAKDSINIISIMSKNQVENLVDYCVKSNKISEKHFKTVVENFIKSDGMEKIFNIISDAIESNEDESIYFDCILRHSVDKKPLIALVEKRTLLEIKECLQELISKEKHTKREVLDGCLLPLISNPNDIRTYFKNLNVVQLGDTIVKYVKPKDLDQFINRLYQSYESEILSVVDRRKVLQNSTQKELCLEVTQRKVDEMVECHESIVNKLLENGEYKALETVFKNVSSKLSKSTVRDLFVEFLKNIDL